MPLIAGVLAATATDPTLTASELFIYPLPLVAMLASVVGILMFTGEAQHGTLAVALVARPARWVIVAAKTIIATTVGLALGAAGMIAGFAGAAVGGVPLGIGSALTSRALWALLYIALAALIGLGVGMIARHTAGAITGLLLWSFVIESLFAPAIPARRAPLPALQRRLPPPRRRPELRGPGGHRRSAGSSAVRPHLRRLRPDQPRHRHAPALPAGLQLNPANRSDDRGPGPMARVSVVVTRDALLGPNPSAGVEEISQAQAVPAPQVVGRVTQSTFPPLLERFRKVSASTSQPPVPSPAMPMTWLFPWS